jgi:hypothetical protein
MFEGSVGNAYSPSPTHDMIYDFITDWEDSWPTMKLTTIERFFSSGFSRDFRTEISCFVPIVRKIPVEWTKKITKKETKNHHHEQLPLTRISLLVANFEINPQSSWIQMALLPMETEYRGSC